MTGFSKFLAMVLLLGLLTSCGFRRKKYENPITKETQQPDKVLFDKAIKDIEKGRYEVARLTLNTLINTYDTSEFMAKAKLAIADSWFREGGSHGLAQAEAEYKDFILFYPTLEEAAESQEKICTIHYKQMEKPDRDVKHAMRAEDECRQLLLQFPNSKFAPRAQQRLREIQEVIAEEEYRVGAFYHTKGSNPAAANRLKGLVDHYPLYSKADEALWKLGDAYSKMGNRFRQDTASAYSRIVKDYPLSAYAEEAKKKLIAMEMPVPEADPVAYARMKYELENRTKPGILHPFWSVFRKGPDVHTAAKSGTPAMTSLRPTIPVSVPPAEGVAAAGGGVSADVTVSTVTDTTALDTKPDARMSPPAEAKPGEAKPPEGQAASSPPASNEPLPTNRQPVQKQDKKKKSNKKK